jgi:hypothetical protein
MTNTYKRQLYPCKLGSQNEQTFKPFRARSLVSPQSLTQFTRRYIASKYSKNFKQTHHGVFIYKEVVRDTSLSGKFFNTRFKHFS